VVVARRGHHLHEQAIERLLDDLCLFHPLVEVLARRVEQHEVQHAIDDRDLEPPPEVLARCNATPTASPEDVTAEVSAILAEIVRGPLPRLTLAHAISLGSELGEAHHLTAEVLLEVMNPDREDLRALLRRPGPELVSRAQRAYTRLFGRALTRESRLAPPVQKDAIGSNRETSSWAPVKVR